MQRIVCAAIGMALASSTAFGQQTYHVELNYNFNGIVHGGEAGAPDDPSGFRSISDRALDFTFGVPSNETLDHYVCVDLPGVLDIVHLGNRNTVDYNGGGGAHYDDVPDGDEIGIQPDWQGDPDQTGDQVTTLNTPILLEGNCNAGVIFQISNGGGSFDVTLRFQSGRSYTDTLTGPDWFGPFNGQPNIGQFPGTQFVDTGDFGDNVLLTEGVVDLSSYAGETVTQVVFGNQTSPLSGYAIVAMNINTNQVGQEFTLDVTTSCPNSGPAQLVASNGTGGSVAFVYSNRTGSFMIPNNYNTCPGTVLGLGGTPTLIGTARGNPATYNANNVPRAACGHVYIQALDLGNCDTSNVVRFE